MRLKQFSFRGFPYEIRKKTAMTCSLSHSLFAAQIQKLGIYRSQRSHGRRLDQIGGVARPPGPSWTRRGTRWDGVYPSDVWRNTSSMMTREVLCLKMARYGSHVAAQAWLSWLAYFSCFFVGTFIVSRGRCGASAVITHHIHFSLLFVGIFIFLSFSLAYPEYLLQVTTVVDARTNFTYPLPFVGIYTFRCFSLE